MALNDVFVPTDWATGTVSSGGILLRTGATLLHQLLIGFPTVGPGTDFALYDGTDATGKLILEGGLNVASPPVRWAPPLHTRTGLFFVANGGELFVHLQFTLRNF